ncbi:MAG: iron-containing alcohol dehydrogenase [Clostridia bacterium]|nr:iron-containing alcohol dehydrogenase [Clostridia bacterium]
MEERRTIKYKLGLQGSVIYIGNNLLTKVPEEIKNIASDKQVVFLSDDKVYQLYGEDLRKGLEKQGCPILTQIVPSGKGYKSWQMAEIIMEEIVKAGFKKETIIISLGGSVITSLGGFVAAIYQGGLNHIQIPTTLNSLISNAVGGEIFLDHSLGKNLIGTYYLPLAVYVDIGALLTSSQEEFLQALSHITQSQVMEDKFFSEFLENNINKIKAQNTEVLQELVYRFVQTKTRILN